MTGEYDIAEILRALGLGTSTAGRKKGMAMFGKKNIQFPAGDDKTAMLSRRRPQHLDSGEAVIKFLQGLPQGAQRNVRISGRDKFVRGLTQSPEFLALQNQNPGRASGPGSRDGRALKEKLKDIIKGSKEKAPNYNFDSEFKFDLEEV